MLRDFLLAHPESSESFYHMMGRFTGGGILMVLLWIVVIIGAIWLIKEVVADNNSGSRSNNISHTDRQRETPEEITRKRLARGEISREEFEEILMGLRGH